MKKQTLKAYYSDVFDIVADYCIDIKKHLIPEKSEVLNTTTEGEIDIFDTHSSCQQMPKGFAVLSYAAETAIQEGIKRTIYEIYFGDNAKGNMKLAKEKAMKFIESHKLKLITDCKHGKVWE